MNRVLIRLGVLSGVLGLGAAGLVAAQYGFNHGGATDESATNDTTGNSSSTAAATEAPPTTLATVGDGTAPADPFARYPAAPPPAESADGAAVETAPPVDNFPPASEALPRYARTAAANLPPAQPDDGSAEYPADPQAEQGLPPREPIALTGANEPTLAPPREEPSGRYGGRRPSPAALEDRGPAEPRELAPADLPATDAGAPLPTAADAQEENLFEASSSAARSPREPAPLEAQRAAAAPRELRADEPLAAADAGGALAEGVGKPGHKNLDGAQSPTLTIEKLAPQEVQVGKPAVFQIQVRNTGQTLALDVQVRDLVPKGTRLVSTTPQAAQPEAGLLVWSLGTIKPGEDARVQIELMPTAEGEIGSVATVHFAAESSVRTVSTKPELVIDVQSPKEVMIGDEVTFDIKVSNPGSGIATAVMLQEALPEQLEHAHGPELEYEIGDLRPGETREVKLTMKAVKAGKLVNALVARGEGVVRAEHTADLEVLAPALDVKIEGPTRRFLDRPATYRVILSNPGTAAAKEVEIAVHVPAGLKFVEANNAGQYDAQSRTVHWLLEELPPGEPGEATLTVVPVELGDHQLKLEGRAQRGLSVQQDKSVVVEGLSAIMFEVADVADPVELGGETTYEIHVVNQGTKAASNLQIVALVPEEMKFVDAEGPARHTADGQRVLFDKLAQLAPKADVTYRVRVQGQRAGDMRIRVQMMTDDMRKPVTKEESTTVYADE